MSKVVKGVGRAIGNVVKGVGNVVKKIVKSPIGKIIAGAALVYFGGAALMGGLAAPAGSGVSGFLSGMGSGLSSAATGIGNAFTALTKGSLSGAGTALSQGFTGAAGTAASTAAQGAATAANAAAATPGMSMAPQALVSPAQAAITQATGGVPMSMAAPAGMAPAAGAANPGLLSGVWDSLGPYGKAAAISGGTQLAGGVIQGYGMQKAQDRQEQLAEDQRARYNANIGGFRYAPPGKG